MITFFFFHLKPTKSVTLFFNWHDEHKKTQGEKLDNKSIKYRHISDNCKYKKIGESNVFFKMFYDFFLYKLIMLLLFL